MVQSQKVIHAPAERIWQALTQKDQLKEWYFDIANFDLKPGATFSFYEPGENKAYYHLCQVLEVEPHKKFSHTWTHPTHSQGTSVVTWTLDEKEGSTLVRLVHEGLESFAEAGPAFAEANYKAGWDAILFSLKNFVYGLKKLHYQISIQAPAQTVWETLWNKTSYEQWTAAFGEGSTYKGHIAQGERIHFLNPENSGIYSELIYCKPPYHATFQHIGEIKKGEEQALNSATERWTGVYESYELSEVAGITTLKVEVETEPEGIAAFNTSFPEALTKLKNLIENKS